MTRCCQLGKEKDEMSDQSQVDLGCPNQKWNCINQMQCFECERDSPPPYMFFRVARPVPEKARAEPVLRASSNVYMVCCTVLATTLGPACVVWRKKKDRPRIGFKSIIHQS